MCRTTERRMSMKNIKVCMLLTGLEVISSISACGVVKEAQSSQGKQVESVQIANPWTDYDTIQDAAQKTGFKLSVPDSISGYKQELVQVLDDELIQVIYQNESDAKKSIYVRKSKGSGDISGDYNLYNDSFKITVGEYEVTEKGNNGQIMQAVWTYEGYTYSVGCPGMDAAQLEEIIGQIK